MAGSRNISVSDTMGAAWRGTTTASRPFESTNRCSSGVRSGGSGPTAGAVVI